MVPREPPYPAPLLLVQQGGEPGNLSGGDRLPNSPQRLCRGSETTRCSNAPPRMAALRAALLECATAERMKALGEKLYELAMAGDLAAAKLLLTYAIGKAPEAEDADRLDLDEWAIADAAPTVGQFLRAFADSLRPADAVAFRRQAYNGANDPKELLERLNEESDKQGKYDPPGPLTRQLLD